MLSPKTTTGSATFTLESKRSGARYTYKVAGGGERPHFVRLLTGPDNTADYAYLGTIFDDSKLMPKRGGNITREAPSFKALSFVLQVLNAGAEFPPSLAFYHEGKCGRCGRELTVPESIETGLGPICAGLMA